MVIFDLDGTLIDAYPAIIASFNYTMEKVGAPVQKGEVIRRAVGWGDRNLLKPFVKKALLEKALQVYRKHHAKALLEKSSLFPHVKGVLRALSKAGIILAVASNRPSRFSKLLIKHLRINDFFRYVLCADALRYGKPHPAILHAIMKRFSMTPRETVFVGDMRIDAEAGRRAKVATIIVTTGSSTLLEIRKEKPYRIIRSIGEVKRIILP